MSAGAIGQFFASPTDLVKVQMQMEGRRKLEGKPLRSVPLEAGSFFPVSYYSLVYGVAPSVFPHLPSCFEPFWGKSSTWEAHNGSGQWRRCKILDFLLSPFILAFRFIGPSGHKLSPTLHVQHVHVKCSAGRKEGCFLKNESWKKGWGKWLVKGRNGLPADGRAQDLPAGTRTCCSLYPNPQASFGLSHF